MSAKTLHITSGDSVLSLWKKASLPGTHIAWRDPLYEGPVPGGLPLERLSGVRADYLSRSGYGNPIRIHHEFEKRDAAIRRAAEFDEIVLWFEHDLFDQLHVLQIVEVLHEMGLGGGRFQLVQADRYLGLHTADELLALLPKRRFFTKAMVAAARRAWQAFTGLDPTALHGALRESYPGLPFMRDALERLCQEFPAWDCGLSRTQKQIVEAVAQGARRKESIYERSQEKEEASFTADAGCYREIGRLASDPVPLLAELDSGYDVTVFGRRVLAGDADWLEHQPLECWIGGTRLSNELHYRWDDRTNELVERSSGPV